jgi:N-acetylmuramoyl-L-alanine amidase
MFERAGRANAAQGDLFVSIHHDSVPNNLIEKVAVRRKDKLL